MKTISLLATLLLLCPARPLAARDVTGFPDAARAAARLGPEFSPQLLRITNSGPAGKYPAVCFAVVFELEHLLWFYCPVDGTQSLSRVRGQPASDRAHLGPLLAQIDPGFRQWEEVPPTAPPVPPGSMAHGCFIDSVVAFRREFARAGAREHPRLLLYYPRRGDPAGAHTVLVYDEGSATKVVDDSRGGMVETHPRRLGADGVALAEAYSGRAVERARWLPLDGELPVALAAARAAGSKPAWAPG